VSKGAWSKEAIGSGALAKMISSDLLSQKIYSDWATVRHPTIRPRRARSSPEVKPPGRTAIRGGHDLPTRDRILEAAVDEFADKGFAGGRLEAICDAARANIRMIYHHFEDKAGLYLAVLEHVLEELRQEELKINVDQRAPLEALLQLFDFTYDHFAAHPKLINLLSGENLLKAAFLKRSTRTPVISSPVLRLIRQILSAGEGDGSIREGIDPLQLYVVMVSLSYFHLSNGHTLSVIFENDLYEPVWLSHHKALARDVVKRFVAGPAAS
jgi:AcrR family transcriptional regulator